MISTAFAIIRVFKIQMRASEMKEMASKGGAGGVKGYYRQKKTGSAITKASSSSYPSSSKKSNKRGGVSLCAPSPQPPALVTSSGSPDLKDGFDENEEILRQFDLDMSCGPCLGMSRLERWERADRLGLNPPKNVAGLLKGGSISLDCLLEGRV